MRLHPVSTCMYGTSPPLLLESLSVSQAAVTLLKPSPTPTRLPALPSSPDNTFSLFQSPTPHPALWLWLKVEDNYVRMLDMNSLKRLEYCSGFTVEISAPAPCFTVLAACAAFFLASYGVRISMMAMKYTSFLGALSWLFMA